MKTLFFFLAICLSIVLYGQDDTDYVMYESIMLDPDTKKMKDFMSTMKYHNEKYHNVDPYKVNVYNILTGPNSGKVVWMMGPCKYSDLDKRPEGEHDTDWIENVLACTNDVHTGEYWKLKKDVSIRSENDSPSPMVYIRYQNVNKGKVNDLDGLYKKMQTVMKSLGEEWEVYVNEFMQGDAIGRHIAQVYPMDNWAELDEDFGFKEEYIKIHGENSWEPFMEEVNSIFSDSWDEIWARVPEMSSK